MRDALEMIAQGQSSATLRQTSEQIAELLSRCVSDYDVACACTLGDRLKAQRAVADLFTAADDLCPHCGCAGCIGENGVSYCMACGVERE